MTAAPEGMLCLWTSCRAGAGIKSFQRTAMGSKLRTYVQPELIKSKACVTLLTVRAIAVTILPTSLHSLR